MGTAVETANDPQERVVSQEHVLDLVLPRQPPALLDVQQLMAVRVSDPHIARVERLACSDQPAA